MNSSLVSSSQVNAQQPTKVRILTSRVQVHMSVVLSILDHQMRRNASNTKSDRVIGTLLGVHLGGGLIEVTGSFPVPHVEKEKEVAIGKDFNRQMKALYSKSHPGEIVVGWYATTCSEISIDAKSCLVHDFYSTSECVNPVHLIVDVSLNNPLSVRGFHSVALASSAISRALAAEFRPLPLEMIASEPERIAIATLAANRGDSSIGTSKNLEQSVERLLSLLDQVCAYVDDVVEGRIPPDPEMGKRIAQLVSAVPHISPDAFSLSFSKSIQDLLMIVMLSNMTRAQLCIAEKLASVM